MTGKVRFPRSNLKPYLQEPGTCQIVWGSIVAPQEYERRLEAIRAERDPNVIPHSRGENGGKRF